MKVALLGVGMMGEAVLSGLVRAGMSGSDLTVTDVRVERSDELVATYGVRFAEDAVDAVSGAEAVLVVVKPHDVPALLDQISASLDPDAVVISLAAGLTLAQLEAHVAPGQPVVRVMPNTPAKVGVGMSAVSPGTSATTGHTARAEQIMRAVGEVVIVEEKYQDAVTAVSGSGPAYLFYVADAMIEAGVHLGLPRPIARELAVQTLLGSATLLKESGEHPAVLRENVTSPGGTTAAALRVLDERAVRAAFLAAMQACRDASVAMAQRTH